ncbi:MAG: hypothetical protein ACFFAU_01285 [Candidatus Hodarchaeota archaeon]
MGSEKRVTQEVEKILLADGKEYEVKPLLFSQVKKVMPIVREFSDSGDNVSLLSPELIDKTLSVAHTILKRTYPKMTIEEVENLVDLGTIRKIFAIGFGSVTV